MNISSYLCIIISLSCIYLGLYTIKTDWRLTVYRLFFSICLCLSLMTLFGSFVFSADSREDAFFFYKLTLFIYTPFHALDLHFSIEFTRRRIRNWVKAIIYLPALIIMLNILLSTSLYTDCFTENGYWVFTTSPATFGYIFYMLYTISYILLFFIILYTWGKKTQSKKEKKQIRVIFTGLGLTAFTGTLFDLVLPSFRVYVLPNLGPLVFIFYIFCLWYALARYRFLVFQPSIVADTIISNIQEMVLLLDPGLRVISVNTKCMKLLSLNHDEIKDTYFCELVLEREYCAAELNRLIQGEGKDLLKRIHYKGGPDEIPTETYFTSVKDEFGDVIGVLVISRENKNLKLFKNRYRITDRQFEIIDMSISGLSNREIAEKLGLAERTVEAHLFHVYDKLGINNKIELINLAVKHNLIVK